MGDARCGGAWCQRLPARTALASSAPSAALEAEVKCRCAPAPALFILLIDCGGSHSLKKGKQPSKGPLPTRVLRPKHRRRCPACPAIREPASRHAILLVVPLSTRFARFQNPRTPAQVSKASSLLEPGQTGDWGITSSPSSSEVAAAVSGTNSCRWQPARTPESPCSCPTCLITTLPPALLPSPRRRGPEPPHGWRLRLRSPLHRLHGRLRRRRGGVHVCQRRGCARGRARAARC